MKVQQTPRQIANGLLYERKRQEEMIANFGLDNLHPRLADVGKHIEWLRNQLHVEMQGSFLSIDSMPWWINGLDNEIWDWLDGIE